MVYRLSIVSVHFFVSFSDGGGEEFLFIFGLMGGRHGTGTDAHDALLGTNLL